MDRLGRPRRRPNGKRLRKKITGPTRKAVADKLRELQRQQDAGVDVRKKSITVADLANEGKKEEGTILRLRPRVERHIIPAGRIGGRQLDQLTPNAYFVALLSIGARQGRGRTSLDRSHAHRDLKKICAHAGVAALSLYEILHTVAALMVDADVPLRPAADLLGHKDLVVKRYRHRADGVVTSHVSVLRSLTSQI